MKFLSFFSKFLANNLPKIHNRLHEPNQIRGTFLLEEINFWSSVFNFQNCFKNISDVLRYAKHGMYGLRMTWIFWILNKKIFGEKIRFYAPQVMLEVKNHISFEFFLGKLFSIFGLLQYIHPEIQFFLLKWVIFQLIQLVHIITR